MAAPRYSTMTTNSSRQLVVARVVYILSSSVCMCMYVRACVGVRLTSCRIFHGESRSRSFGFPIARLGRIP